MQPPESIETQTPPAPPRARPGTGRNLTISVIVLFAVLLLAFIIVHLRDRSRDETLAQRALALADAPAPIDVARVLRSPASRTLELPGQASAWYASTIYARVSGYVNIWKADIGDHVRKGDTLATIDTPELDQQLNAALAKVAADKAGVVVAESEAHFANVTNNRWKDSPKGVVSEQERDEKQAAYDSAKARLQAAQAQVALDQADVDRFKAFTEFKKVVAPYDGVITKRQIDIGDLVTAGSISSTTALYEIAQFDKVRVFIDVPQVASSEIHDGMTATAVSREFPDDVFTGTVARSTHAINESSKTLRVEVDIQNPDLKLLPGTYLEVNLDIKNTTPPLRIPASALNFRSGGPEVAIVQSDNTVKFHAVTIARDMGEFVEIATGLNDNDLVALNISNQISDGDRVQVTKTPQAAAAPRENPMTSADSK